jgi:hypothetical protein
MKMTKVLSANFTTEPLMTTEKTDFFEFFSVLSAVLSASVVKNPRWLSKSYQRLTREVDPDFPA